MKKYFLFFILITHYSFGINLDKKSNSSCETYKPIPKDIIKYIKDNVFRGYDDCKKPFLEKLKTIKEDKMIVDKDLGLSVWLNLCVNPKKIPDGHCAKCAFNTYLHIKGKTLKEAEEPGSLKFKIFGDWFYKKMGNERTISLLAKNRVVEADGEHCIKGFRNKVAFQLIKYSKKDDAMLVSVGAGTHWFTAYNDGERIWFLDSQTGQGFNVYGDTIDPDEIIEAFPINVEDIDYYNKIIYPEIKKSK